MVSQEIWTTLKILDWTKDYLSGKGVENARLEAEWLLCSATDLDRVGLYLNFEKPLSESELSAFRAMVARRAKREPLQHILGTQEFFGLEFAVSPAVLIPRHDTETLVEEALAILPDAKKILDIGTGSGCIAISLAKQLPAASVTAVDISAEALEVAKLNGENNAVNVEFLHGSLFEPVAGKRFDLITSNPPYIPTADINNLTPEVRDFDPRSALDGGFDGLDIYRILIPAALDYLLPGGCLLVEVGIGQAPAVSSIFQASPEYTAPKIVLDRADIPRVVVAKRKDLA